MKRIDRFGGYFKRYPTPYLAAVVILTAGVGFLFFREDIQPLVTLIKSDQTHPAVLIGCFLILPLLFFPITVLLVLVGMRFDALAGILIIFMLTPFHLLVSFFVVRSVFRSRIEQFARKKNFGIFTIPPKRHLEFAFLFMAVPGLPYTLKNYLLPVSGIPFRMYFLISWLVQGVMGIPFVVLGDAASQWNIHLVLIALSVLLTGYFIARQIRKRYDRMVESVSDR
jgi:uncharacterized membrane protein YdjX (TVP38/TMEM64 family)